MPFDTAKILNISGLLIRKSLGESGNRSAANRAYYCAYHACSRIAHSLNYIPSRPHSKNFGHTELSNILSQHLDASDPHKEQNIKLLGGLLKQCMDLRVEADYRDANVFTFNKASDTYFHAERILQIAARL